MLNNEDLRTAEQKLEDAHQKLLLLNQEYFRVQNLHRSEEQQIAELQNIKATLQEAINKGSDELSKIKKEIDGNTTLLGSISTEVANAIAYQIKLRNEIDNDQTSLNLRADTLASNEASVSQREDAVTKAEVELEKSIVALEEKHRKINDFIASF